MVKQRRGESSRKAGTVLDAGPPPGIPLKDAPVWEDLASMLPKDVFVASNSKAAWTLTRTACTVVAGYAALVFLPWFLLPLGWVMLGLAGAGIYSIAQDCSKQLFLPNKTANDVVGAICMLPLLSSFESFKLKHMENFEKAMQTPAWFFSSFWGWLSSQWARVSSRKMMANLVLLYAFAAAVFPLAWYNLGVWGLAKYYFIPWLVYHFWVTTFLKVSYMSPLVGTQKKKKKGKKAAAVAEEVSAYMRVPRVMAAAANHLNYDALRTLGAKASEAIPSYHLERATQAVCEKAKKTVVSSESLWQVLTSTVDEHGNVRRLNTGVVLWLYITPLLSLYGLSQLDSFVTATWITAFIFFYAAGLAITAGYHRLWSHRSYKSKRPLELVLLFWGTSAFEGSVFEWCVDHRAHHRHVDTVRDPYNIYKGFFYAHIGWLHWRRDPEERFQQSDISDLRADPALRFQHKYFPLLALLSGVVIPTLVCGLGWGDWFGGFFIAAMLKSVLVNQFTFCINSLAHYWGEKTYSDKQTAGDSVIVSLITWGEGYHNSHHEFPFDYRNGVSMLAFDPGKWLIWGASRVGLAYEMLRMPAECFAKGRLQMEEKRLMEEKAKWDWGPTPASLPMYTWDDVRNGCTAGQRLLIVHDGVYELSQFIGDHPGGASFIKAYTGKDATEVFTGERIHIHTACAETILAKYRVGNIATGDSSDE